MKDIWKTYEISIFTDVLQLLKAQKEWTWYPFFEKSDIQ